ncbi:chromosome partitioning protein ParB [Variovorax sp. GB1P17]|uniref:chromosome partitioning protein ParB n=1 Tax=Variovorax sp. GB1P17 TaxID=3443740 RepID=UPI003F446DD5
MTTPRQSKTPRRAPIGRRPAADPATAWVHRENAGGAVVEPVKSQVFTARLTIDVTPALRGRIKVIAFGRGITAAEMLRELLEREFAEGTA